MRDTAGFEQIDTNVAVGDAIISVVFDIDDKAAAAARISLSP